MAEPYRVKPVFLTHREIRRYKCRGVSEGAAAIKSVSPERKPGKRDSRDNDERLVDLLCSLRQWAAANDVSFHSALKSSEHHFMVETGKLAENTTPP